MKHIQNNQKSMGKSITAFGILKISRKKIRETKVLRLLPNVCDFHRRPRRVVHACKKKSKKSLKRNTPFDLEESKLSL